MVTIRGIYLRREITQSPGYLSITWIIYLNLKGTYLKNYPLYQQSQTTLTGSMILVCCGASIRKLTVDLLKIHEKP